MAIDPGSMAITRGALIIEPPIRARGAVALGAVRGPSRCAARLASASDRSPAMPHGGGLQRGALRVDRVLVARGAGGGVARVPFLGRQALALVVTIE